MKKLLLFTSQFALCIFILMPIHSYGQLLNNIKKSIGNGVEKGLLYTLEDKVEKEVTEILKSESESTQDTTTAHDANGQMNSQILSSLLGYNADIKVEESYVINLSSTATYADYTNRKEEHVEIKMGFGSDCYYAQTHDTDYLMIYDYNNELMIMTDHHKKAYQVLPTNSAIMKTIAKNEDQKNEESSLVKTGKTKSILGYSCDEYTLQDKDTNTVLWITQELSIPGRENFENLAEYHKENEFYNSPYGGYMLSMEAYNKKGDKTSSMIVNSIDTQVKTIDLEGYERF